VLPELVVVDGGGWRSLEYAKLTPYLVKAIQELQDDFDTAIQTLRAEFSETQRQLEAQFHAALQAQRSEFMASMEAVETCQRAETEATRAEIASLRAIVSELLAARGDTATAS
jgi:hypothetical protein